MEWSFKIKDLEEVHQWSLILKELEVKYFKMCELGPRSRVSSHSAQQCGKCIYREVAGVFGGLR